MRIRWNLDSDLPLYAPRYNIATSNEQKVPVIVRHENSNQFKFMHWGLIPSWATDPTIGSRMINARAETLIDKPAFKHLVGSRRCIIPAGFSVIQVGTLRKIPIIHHFQTGGSLDATQDKDLQADRTSRFGQTFPRTGEG
jgi:hypothetical protein